VKVPRPWFARLAAAALIALPVTAAANAVYKASAKPPVVHVVTLQDMKFGPMPTHVRVGDTIEWANDDIFLHSATAADRSFDVELKPKAHMWTTFHKAGTFPFSCRYHPGMTATLVVAP
jgi:plastocyanin